MGSERLSRLGKWLAGWKSADRQAQGLRGSRPVLEVLEDRTLLSATLTGTVFQDFNANGVQNLNGTVNNASQGTVGTASDLGVAGLTITAYRADGTVAGAATSAANGSYTITDSTGTSATAYRLEFSNLPAGATDTLDGPDSHSSVQFVTGSTNGASLGLLQAGLYSPKVNPTLYSQIYHTGDPRLPGTITFGNNQTYTPQTSGSDPALVGFSYNAGTQTSDTSLADYQVPSTPTLSVSTSAIGSTFGLAYNPNVQQLYAASYTKRFAAYGPGATAAANGDPGAIYTINTSTGAVSVFTSLPNMTNFRALPGQTGYTNNSDYEADNGSDPSNPNLGWQSVGTTSLGGMDINTSATQMYVMDLEHRELNVLGIKPDGTWDGTRTAVPIPIPTDASAAANMRPFAVRYYNGLVYIGEIDSAQSTQDPTQLRAYVFTFNPATNTFSSSPVLEAPLNYARGSSYGGSDNFLPWSATYQNINGTASGDGATKYPQPMLTGIAFDSAGNMVLGIRDRNGDQTTRFLESDPAHDPNTQEGISAGALLRASPNATQTAWTLENNGTSGGVTSAGANSGFGPGGGMFYYQDNYAGSSTSRSNNGGHNDVTLGGVEQVPGFPDVVTTSFDPDINSGSTPTQSASYRTGGIRWFHNNNDALGNAGTLTKSYMLYSIDTAGTFGKADGVGNVVAQTFPAPLEIGNRIWKDSNGNGIQDAGEPGIANVTATLFDVTANKTVGTTTTDAGGAYDFNSSNVTGGLLPSHSYQVIIDTTQSALTGMGLTRAGQGTDLLLSSKASLVGSNAVIALTTGGPGQIDHSEDAGFEPLAQVGGVVFDNSKENDGVFHAGSDPGINGVTVTLTGTDDQGNPVKLSQTTSIINGQAGSYLFSGLRPSNRAGYTITETGTGMPAAFIDGKDSAPGSLGGKQANAYADQVTAIPVAAGDKGSGYNFGEIRGATLSGVVFDNTRENDGVFHLPSDSGLNGVTVTLTGIDDRGDPVKLTQTTSTLNGQPGSYVFSGLRPSSPAGYTITETAVPAGYVYGKYSATGSLGATHAGTTVGQIPGIVVTIGASGTGYNFSDVRAPETASGPPAVSGPSTASASAPAAVVDPTFLSKVLLLGSDANGKLAQNIQFVNQLYQQDLGRSPTIDEVNYWVFQLDAGVSPTQVAAGI